MVCAILGMHRIDCWHVSARIAAGGYLRLMSYLVGLAVHRSVESLVAEFHRVPFERYAPVRRQLLNILRAVYRTRKDASLEAVPAVVLRLHRRIVKPFGEASAAAEAA